MAKFAARVAASDKHGLRATGAFERHPDGCECRKCRRARAARARRLTPRYGQQKGDEGDV